MKQKYYLLNFVSVVYFFKIKKKKSTKTESKKNVSFVDFGDIYTVPLVSTLSNDN